jgi:predicted ester cyclase
VYKDKIRRPMQASAATKEKEDRNKLVVTRFIEELWNQRKVELADELIAPNCVTHQLRSGESPVGSPRTPESVKREAAAWFAGFSDLAIRLDQLVAECDMVVSHCTMRGTHTGLWMGLGPTGKKVSIPIMTIHRLVDARIVEDWVLVGSLVLFQQLGLVPAIDDIVGRTARCPEGSGRYFL